jgi:hypothetical protein
VGQAKTHEQLLVIVDRFKGKEDTMFAELEKKYGQPVKRPATPTTPTGTAPSGSATPSTACSTPDGAAAPASLIPDVFKAEAEERFRQQEAEKLQLLAGMQAAQQQQQSQNHQIDSLKHNLSALYQQSAQPPQPQPVIAANGSNYSDLMQMAPPMESQQQQMMNGMQQQLPGMQQQLPDMQQPLPGMQQQMIGMQQMPCMQQGLCPQQMQQMQQQMMQQMQQLTAMQQMQQLSQMQNMVNMTQMPVAPQSSNMQQGYGFP